MVLIKSVTSRLFRQSMAREVSSLRDRTSQLDAELEVTKRHLTNERYER